MAKIIQFDPNKIRAEQSRLNNLDNRSAQRPTFKTPEYEIEDSFEYEEPDFDEDEEEEPLSYSIQEVISLAGSKKTDEIFENFLPKGRDDISGTISPPTGDVPLKESMRTIWGKSKESDATKRAKISELARTRRAFLTLEKEASKKHNKLTGENKRIKIVVRTEDDEAPLTDILDKQIKFYEKRKLSATVDLIGQRIAHGFGVIVDKMTNYD